MPSLKSIREQCKRRIKSGNASVGSNLKDPEIDAIIGQVLNRTLRADFFSTVLPQGETIPSGCMLASYDDVAVEQYKDRSRTKLPVFPVNLPRNMGIFNITCPDCPDQYFIPIPAGQGMLARNQPLLNDLSGHVGYEANGDWVVFTKDITGTKPVTVSLQLVVSDVSSLDEYAPLPIHPDMSFQVIQEVVNFFLAEGQPDKLVDSGAEPTKMTGK